MDYSAEVADEDVNQAYKTMATETTHLNRIIKIKKAIPKSLAK